MTRTLDLACRFSSRSPSYRALTPDLAMQYGIINGTAPTSIRPSPELTPMIVPCLCSRRIGRTALTLYTWPRRSTSSIRSITSTGSVLSSP